MRSHYNAFARRRGVCIWLRSLISRSREELNLGKMNKPPSCCFYRDIDEDYENGTAKDCISRAKNQSSFTSISARSITAEADSFPVNQSTSSSLAAASESANRFDTARIRLSRRAALTFAIFRLKYSGVQKPTISR